MSDYDVIVLGGGSAGSSAAASASQAGARTLMINDGELGGLCILRGCMPTKAMLATAHAIHETEHLEPLGVGLDCRAEPDFNRIMARKDAQVARFKRAKIESIRSEGYEVLDGRARFAPGGSVAVDGRTLEAGRYVIATGSKPAGLAIPGIERVPVLDSDQVMRLTTQPSALVVQGGGPIGLELAQFFARIGTEVLLVNRSPLLSRCDDDCGAELTRALGDEDRIELAVPGAIEELQPRGSGLVARVRSGGRVRDFNADALLLAVGRDAMLDDLSLENVGLTPERGRLEHDEQMRTANTSVYVAGDATGTYQILHLANQEGHVAGHNAAGAQPERAIDYRLRMAVIFTDPPYAQVGLTESAARAEGRDIVVGRENFPETGRAITMEVRYGLWKVIADRRSGEILGTTILGPRADDLAHVIAAIMHFHGRVDDIFKLPWYHPTLSEVLLGIGRDLRGRIETDGPVDFAGSWI